MWAISSFSNSKEKPSSNRPGSPLREKISESLIVQYNGYYDTTTRHRIITKNLVGAKLSVSIQNRPNALSDFDVLEFDAGNRQAIVTFLSREANVIGYSEDKGYSRRHLHGWRGNPQPLRGYRRNLEIRRIAEQVQAPRLWKHGYTGKDVRVAIFDTGIGATRRGFRHIKDVVDFTNEGTANDVLGHGTLVAGVIGSSNKRCPGIAPEASLYVYKVFTSRQLSSTAWFLDAFNKALLDGINVINLSIGGPDFTDQLFAHKMREVTSSGIIVVSAIGNDGPTFGTLNNPADEMDVIGVGAINIEGRIASYSSRGMTTWELPGGYGRLKPDILAYGSYVYGSSLSGRCRMMSGTSVASPVVTGAVALLLSSLPQNERRNVALVKQSLIDGARRLSIPSTMFEQGAGQLDLPSSLFPSYIDFTECPYSWPYCTQPLFYSMQPTIINVTVLNSFGGRARIIQEPLVESPDEKGQLIRTSFSFASETFLWASYLAVFLEVSPDAATFTGTASARIQIRIKVDVRNGTEEHVADFWLRVNIVPTPSRSHRVLWDQYHNLGYPHGFVPRDDLRQRSNPLDWHADHPHTNFRVLYQRLRSNGYYVEVLRQPATCIDLGLYAAYLLVDPEEEFFRQEVQAISGAVKEGRTNLLVFADWFNATLIEKIQFVDETTGKVWMPATGGCNVPALNELLKAFGFALGDQVFEGNVQLGATATDFNSGSAIIRAPKDAVLGFSDMNDLGWELISGQPSPKKARVPVFGYDKPTNSSGFISVFGDSDCLENEACFELLDILLHAASTEGRLPRTIADHLSRPSEEKAFLQGSSLPRRFVSTDFAKHSKTVRGYTRSGQPLFRAIPSCSVLTNVLVHLSHDLRFPSNLKPTGINDSQVDQMLEQSSLNTSTLSIEMMLDDTGGGYSPSGSFTFLVILVSLAVLLIMLYVARAFNVPRVLLKSTLVRPLRQLLRRML